MKLHGVHHVSGITRDVQKNYDFYTKILGMKLIKSTIHHEDERARKLYYATHVGLGRTCLSFVERKKSEETLVGNNKIYGTSFRIPRDESLDFWRKRFVAHSITHEDQIEIAGQRALPFEDEEGHKLFLISSGEDIEVNDEFIGSPEIPSKDQIIGLGPTMIRVSKGEDSILVLEEVLGLQLDGEYKSPLNGDPVSIYTTGDDDLKNEIHLQKSKSMTQGITGYSSIHHIAFRVKNLEELRNWRDLFERIRMPNSGIVNHLYYRAIYFRDGNGILYELATDEPGFTVDESVEELGSSLSLPKSLRKQEEKIEKKLTPLITSEPQ